MISIHLDDFVTNCIVFSLCWLAISHGIVLLCKAWIFWQERKIIRDAALGKKKEPKS